MHPCHAVLRLCEPRSQSPRAANAIREGTSALGAITALFLIVGTAWQPASATAMPRPGCPPGSDPYHSSPAVLKACGNRLLPRRSQQQLPDGGTQYNYETAPGQLVSLTVPPSFFDSANASPAELARYGVPPEPPAVSPEYPLWKAMIHKGIHFLPAPPELAEGPPKDEGHPRMTTFGSPSPLLTEPDPSATGSTFNWSGYIDWNGKGSFTHSTGYFIEPSDHGSCATSSSYTWAGIGGWGGNPDLGQDGTAQHEGGLGEHQSWTEILPGQTHPIATTLYATPGHWFLADTQYTGGEHYSFYMYNYANGHAVHASGTGPADANVNDFIVERPGSNNLLNFSSVAFQGFTNNSSFAKNKTERVNMENESRELNASPGNISTNKYAFTDYYHHCTGAAGGTGAEAAEGALPIVTTGSATNVAQSTATVNGSVNPKGFDTHYHFEYGLEAENYEASTPEVDAGSGSSEVPVSANLAGLSPGTTYHYRLLANSTTGIEAGADATFTTPGTPPPPPPTATTERASSVTAHAATLEAGVNPNGADTHYYFEYGPNSGLYELDAPAIPGNDAGSGSSLLHVSVEIKALASYTTYYYRIVASNSTGTSYGAEKEFTTTAAGTVLGWGANAVGQLGDGTTTGPEKCTFGFACSELPVAVSGSLSEVASVSAGGSHSLAVSSTGTVMAWGPNTNGDLGNGTTIDSSVPVKVSNITTATSASAGEDFSLALLKNNTVEAWGRGTEGQLGNGTTTSSSTPVAVSGITEATAISAGQNHGLALLKSGTVMAWGANTVGQLGNGTTTGSNVPVKVSNITEAVAVSAGYNFSLAVLKNGTVMAWGANEAGQLGNGTTTNSDVPVAVSSLSEVGSVAAGKEDALALLKNGTVMAWGVNTVGQLGNGTTTNSDVPVKVSNITEATAIAADGPFDPSLALLKNGTVQSWGNNNEGDLGVGSPGPENCGLSACSRIPVTVNDLSGVTSIASGLDRGFAVGSTPSFTQTIDGGHTLNAVSCVPSNTIPPTTDCVASDNLGNAYYATNVSASGAATWNTWNGPGTSPSWAVQCPTTTLCLLADGTNEANGGNLYYATSLGGAWTLAFSPIYGVDAISCASSTFCVSGQNNLGYFGVSTSPGSTSWIQEEQGSAKMNGVSCLSSSFCAMVDSVGDIHVATTKKQIQSSSWTITNVDGTNALNAVACTSTTSCVAVDSAGNVLNLTINGEGNATVAKQNLDGTNSLTAVTCTTASTCVAVDSAGGVFVSTSDGTSWTKQYEYAPGDNLTSISCASAYLCTATNTAGNTTTINPR